MPRNHRRKDTSRASRPDNKNWKNEQTDVQPSRNPIKPGEQLSVDSPIPPVSPAETDAKVNSRPHASRNEVNKLHECFEKHKWLIENELRARRVNELWREDLRSAAIVGLLESLNNYDPTKGGSFEAYARKRIRGHIVAEYHRQLGYERAAADNRTKYNRAEHSLYQRNNYPPKAEEVYEELKWKRAVRRNHSSARRAASPELSYDLCLNAPANASTPEAHVLREEAIDEVQRAVSQLNCDESKVIHFCYLQSKPR